MSGWKQWAVDCVAALFGHPSDTALLKYLVGAAGRRARSVERHLACCPRCRRKLESFRLTLAQVERIWAEPETQMPGTLMIDWRQIEGRLAAPPADPPFELQKRLLGNAASDPRYADSRFEVLRVLLGGRALLMNAPAHGEKPLI